MGRTAINEEKETKYTPEPYYKLTMVEKLTKAGFPCEIKDGVIMFTNVNDFDKVTEYIKKEYRSIPCSYGIYIPA